ncbi:hypothetical protein RF11_02718 [Thelohanellus kitauei]|uniref:CCHC-type domain-containing protein n=1 Tax=Thelohanellus kitauei TaxID=669202 RepID=A0A0C2J863_THEKT|nr:hypothetical protein RF11_02718 [Thelohanellus kitauei]
METFYISLKALASKCEFGNQIDEPIGDQLIFGIENYAFKQELVKRCESKKTTLAEVLKLALFLESTSHENDDQPGVLKIEYSKKSTQFRLPNTRTIDREKDCLNCGNERHNKRSDFPAADAECFNCKTRGHFSSVCMKKRSIKINKFEQSYSTVDKPDNDCNALYI